MSVQGFVTQAPPPLQLHVVLGSINVRDLFGVAAETISHVHLLRVRGYNAAERFIARHAGLLHVDEHVSKARWARGEDESDSTTKQAMVAKKREAEAAAATTAVAGAPDIVVITGLSGSGMSSATNAFEDLGYFCVDNLPLTLLPTFARLVQRDDVEEAARIRRAALVINIREGHFLNEFEPQLKALRRGAGLNVFVLFFEASDEVLLRRFSETRRPHPADTGAGLLASIRAERAAMEKILPLADLTIDTSEHTVHTLRRYLVERFSPDLQGTPMRVQVLSFGHKYGSPRDVDLMFDVRHLPNPHFVPELRAFSGHDRRVVNYLNKSVETAETLRRFGELLDYLLPLYRREGKSYVTVGIGCTGGRHRSVMIANALARRLRRSGFDAASVHRDVRKTKSPRPMS